MFSKRYTLLLLYPLLLLSKKSEPGKLVIVIYREPEIMYGHIKQVIELRPDFHTEPELCSDDTTDFDKNGNSVETHLGIKGRLCVEAKYTNKYNAQGVKLETEVVPENNDDDKRIYKFNASGRVIESGLHTKQGKLSDKVKYKYDPIGNIVESINYHDNNGVSLKELYKYDRLHHLVERDFYKGATTSIDKTLYHYVLFDKNGNWISRVETRHNTEKFTITRKIEYY